MSDQCWCGKRANARWAWSKADMAKGGIPYCWRHLAMVYMQMGDRELWAFRRDHPRAPKDLEVSL